MRSRAAIAACLVLAMSATAFAQSNLHRVYVGVNGGVHVSDTDVAQSFNVQKNFEDTPISVDIGAKRGVLVDGGFVVRIAGPFGAGFAATVATSDTDATVTGSVPHPFFFRQPRSVSGTTGTTHRETAGHIQAVFIVPSRRLDLMLSGGPSVFSVRQTLVTDITYSESYPYDAAEFSGAETTRSTSKAKVGFHAGVDVAWKFSDHVGIGGMARFARANITLDAPNNPSMKVDVGGLLAGAGLRLAF